MAVHTARDVVVELAIEEHRNAAGELDDFDAAPDVAARLLDRLSVLARYYARQGIEILLEEMLITEKDPGSIGRRRVRPGRQGGAGSFHSTADVFACADRRLRDYLPVRRVVNGSAIVGRRADFFSTDEIWTNRGHDPFLPIGASDCNGTDLRESALAP